MRRPSRSPASSAAICSSSCSRWSQEFGAHLSVGISGQEIPYPFVSEPGDELDHDGLSAAELARHFPTPMLAHVGDEIADGAWVRRGQAAAACAFRCHAHRFFAAPAGTLYRHRLADVQPWILFTNYQRYVDQFLDWAMASWCGATAPMMRSVCRAARWIGPRRSIADARRRRSPRRPGIASRCRPTT